MRPTNTSSWLVVSNGIGYTLFCGSSLSWTPSALLRTSFAFSTSTSLSHSSRMLSEWLRSTGTRTHVQLTSKSSSCQILRPSFCIFHSSLEMPSSSKSPICGMRLYAIWYGNAVFGAFSSLIWFSRSAMPFTPAPETACIVVTTIRRMPNSFFSASHATRAMIVEQFGLA